LASIQVLRNSRYTFITSRVSASKYKPFDVASNHGALLNIMRAQLNFWQRISYMGGRLISAIYSHYALTPKPGLIAIKFLLNHGKEFFQFPTVRKRFLYNKNLKAYANVSVNEFPPIALS